jgi:hypothetical protein
MKTALKHKSDEFLVMPLKHVLSVMGLVNHPGTPKLWAIAHKNGHKRKNDEFLVMSLKHVLGVIDVGVLDTGVSRSTCSWAPSSAHLQPRGEPTTQAMEKTLMRRRLMRRAMVEMAKDQKTSSRAPAGEEKDQVHISSACWRAEQEDTGQKTAYDPRCP